MITDIAGVRVGHWTNHEARTGCTVVLFPEGTVASGEVRGGAPAARETALLEPTCTVTQLHALVLTGGSAFGLASADGVMRFCEEQGLGVATPAGSVPIVVALACFDLAVGDPSVRPGTDEGYAACQAAQSGSIELGLVGGGTGATVAGDQLGQRRPGGLVSTTVRAGDLVVSALVVVNAAGAPGADDEMAPELAAALNQPPANWKLQGDTAITNTVIGLVATNARLDKLACHLVSQSAHDGLARSVFPAHTSLDGDAFVTASCGDVEANTEAVRTLATHAVAASIRSVA